jgi:hypothetical protein
MCFNLTEKTISLNEISSLWLLAADLRLPSAQSTMSTNPFLAFLIHDLDIDCLSTIEDAESALVGGFEGFLAQVELDV